MMQPLRWTLHDLYAEKGEKVADVSLGGSCLWDLGRDRCVIAVARVCCVQRVVVE